MKKEGGRAPDYVQERMGHTRRSFSHSMTLNFNTDSLYSVELSDQSHNSTNSLMRFPIYLLTTRSTTVAVKCPTYTAWSKPRQIHNIFNQGVLWCTEGCRALAIEDYMEFRVG